MKRCPECRRDYYDDTLFYCLDDGNVLLEGPRSPDTPVRYLSDEPATAILSGHGVPPSGGSGSEPEAIATGFPADEPLNWTRTFWLAHDALGRAYEQQVDLNQALAEYQRARQLEQNVPEVLALVGRAYALLGRKAETQKVIEDLKGMSKQAYVPPYNFAKIYAGLEDKMKHSRI